MHRNLRSRSACRSKLFLSWVVLHLATFQTRAEDSHVVVISLDGFPSFLMDDPQALLPVLRGLMASGVVANPGTHVSDQGFISVDKTTRPKAIMRREGLIELTGDQIETAREMIVSEGGIAMVNLTDPATAGSDAQTIRPLFEGIAAILTPEEYSRYHSPVPAKNSGMADLILATKDGYSFSGLASGDQVVVENRGKTGSHCYLSTNPQMNGLFVEAGAGIRHIVRIGAVNYVDVAPTIAHLLDAPLKESSGRLLSEILVTTE